MSANDVFLLTIRWLHLVSAAAWVGGSLFYLVVLRPALRRSPESSRAVQVATATEFRTVVDICIFVLVATGIIIAFNRLTQDGIGVPYVTTLGVKIALSVWMFVLAVDRRRRRGPPIPPSITPSPVPTKLRKADRALSGYNGIVFLGIVVFFLSDLLRLLFDLGQP